MIASKTHSTQSGNLGGKAVAMTLDEGATAHIMGIMTNMYEDPITACIREYATNAADAHVEAGVKRPIEITLPGQLSPFLSIRDFGIGLDADGIERIYSRYGTSTKRGTNAQNGMLGIGCKSALTYTEQFTVTAVKDGTRTQVAVTRDPSGGGTMTIVDESQTDEGNGVTVTIPVKISDVSLFVAKAEFLFSFWQPGTVLLDGKAPAQREGFEVAAGIIVTDRNQSQGSGDFVVMGGVPYPAPSLSDLTPYNRGVTAYVPIGTVDFAPAREGLMDTPRTRDALTAISDTYKAEVVKSVSEKVSKCATAHEALALRRTVLDLVPSSVRDQITYKGRAIPSNFELPNKTKITVTRADSYKMGSSHTSLALNVDDVPDAIWVEGYDLANFTKTHKQKLLTWMNDHNLTARSFVLVAAIPADWRPWIDPARLADWNVVAKIKLNPTTTPGYKPKRLTGSYDVRYRPQDPNGRFTPADMGTQVPADKLDVKNPLIYVNTNVWSGSHYADRIAYSIDGPFTLVCLPANRIGKFQRDFPAATDYATFMREQAKLFAASLTKEQGIALAQDYAGDKGDLTKIDPAKVKDPYLRRAAKIARTDISKLTKKHRRLNAPLPTWRNPLDKYPLFDRYVLDKKPAHVYSYLNNAYADASA